MKISKEDLSWTPNFQLSLLRLGGRGGISRVVDPPPGRRWWAHVCDECDARSAVPPNIAHVACRPARGYLAHARFCHLLASPGLPPPAHFPASNNSSFLIPTFSLLQIHGPFSYNVTPLPPPYIVTPPSKKKTPQSISRFWQATLSMLGNDNDILHRLPQFDLFVLFRLPGWKRGKTIYRLSQLRGRPLVGSRHYDYRWLRRHCSEVSPRTHARNATHTPSLLTCYLICTVDLINREFSFLQAICLS